MDRQEVARHRRPKAHGCFEMLGMKSRKECLEIVPEMEPMLNLVILTFIYMERLRMGKDRWRSRS